MIRRRWMGAAVASGMFALVVLALTAAPSADAQVSPVVTQAVQVTDNPSVVRAHSSPQMAMNPTNGELVIVDADIRGDHRCAVHLSTDSGRTWSPGGDPMLEPFTECSRVVINGPYATVDFDNDGVLYMAFRASDPKWSNPHPPPTIPRHVFVARSEDGGRTFETTMVYEGPEEAAEAAGDLPQEGHNERPMVAVNRADPSEVFVGWYQPGWGGVKPRSYVAVSTDGGRSFDEPVDISDERGGTQPRLAVDGDGVVHAAYGAATFGLPDVGEGEPPHPQPLVYRRSTDAGQTWSDHQEVEPGHGAKRKWLLVADQSSDHLYATWYGNPDSDDRGKETDWHVYVRTSPDGGSTWGDRVVVNDQLEDPAGIKRYDPGLAVAPNGRVDVAWYDFRNSPTPEGLDHNDFNVGGFQDVYYSWSSDNGQTWSEDLRITDRMIDRNIGVWSNNVHSHTNVGIASRDDAVFVAWQDTRNGNAETDAEDTYFASVGLDGHAPDLVASTASLPRGALWGAGLAGAALAMGFTMIVAWLLVRRRSIG